MIEAPCGPLVTNQRNSSARTSASAPDIAAQPDWRFTPNAARLAGSAPTATSPASSNGKAQPNKLGSYHCWNRVYEPATGRWTTPDPAMSPWTNLVSYVGKPTLSTDSTGLEEEIVILEGHHDEVLGATPFIGDDSGDPAITAFLKAVNEAKRTLQRSVRTSYAPSQINRSAGLPKTIERPTTDNDEAMQRCKLQDVTWDPTHDFTGSAEGYWNRSLMLTTPWMTYDMFKEEFAGDDLALRGLERAKETIDFLSGPMIAAGRGRRRGYALFAFGYVLDEYTVHLRGSFTFRGVAHYKCECPDELIDVRITEVVDVAESYVALSMTTPTVFSKYQVVEALAQKKD